MHQQKLCKQSGFTLIELIIVIIIISILAMYAIPSYRTWVLQSHRSDAMSTLAQDQTTLERCYAQTFSYNGTCAALPTFPQISPQGYYSITLSNQTATTYTLTATTSGGQTQDIKCTTMSIDQAGSKLATSTSCWQP